VSCILYILLATLEAILILAQKKWNKTKTSKKDLNMDGFKLINLYVNRWMHKGNHSACGIMLQSYELWDKQFTEVPQMIGV